MADQADQFYLGIPATLQVLPAPIAPVPSDSVLYSFKGVCSGLVQPSGVCEGTLTGALDAIESAICSLQAGGGSGGSGGVSLNCGTLSPLLTAGNCIAAATGSPAFVAGYSAAGAPLRYYPYTAPVAPFISSCTEFNSRLSTCPPSQATSTTTYLGFDASGNPVKAPLPAVVTPAQFIPDCATFTSKLKSTTNGGCLPEDAVSATKVLAIDTLGNPIIRPLVFPPSTIDCVDLRSKLGTCLTLQGTPLSTVIGRDAAGTVGYYPAPTGGTGGSTSSVAVADTSSIDMSVSQVGSIFTVSGSAIISPAAGNTLQSTAAGLYVPTPAGSTQFIADCAGLNAKLRSTANGGCLASGATAQTAYLGFDSSGAPVIAPLPAAPTQFIANCTDFNSRLNTCVGTSPTALTTYLAYDGSGNPVKAPLPATPTQFIANCSDFLTRHAPTGSGGCVTQDSSGVAFVYAWDPTLNAMRIRPMPASSTPFIANCTDFTNKLKSTANGGCIGSVAASQVSYYAVDGSGTPVLAPLPVTPAQFISSCADLLSRIRSTGVGGCLPSSGSAQTNYLGFDASGNATIAPLPATPTQFIANCTDFNSRLNTCVGTSATALTTYLAYDGSGNPVKAPLPAGSVSFISDCADFTFALQSTANGGCLSEVTVQQSKVIAIDSAGGPVIAPSPIRTATRWLLNSPATATTLAVTGGGIVTASFADTETTKAPVGATATATATTVTIARSGYYDLSAAVLARVSSATAVPANSAISLFGQIVVTRPAAAAANYRIGQQPIMLNSIPAAVLSTGVDYMFSGSVDSIWLPAGSTVRVQIQSANVANAGAYVYTLAQPIGGGQRLSITERTVNTATV